LTRTLTDAPPSRSGLLGRTWRRAEVLPPVLIAGFCNAAFAETAWHVVTDGLVPTLMNGLSISVILWAGFFLGVSWIREDDGRPVTRRDLAVCGLALLTFFLPYSKPSWVGLSVLAVYATLTSAAGSNPRRGAAVLAAMTYPMFWSKHIFWLLSDRILPIDAVIVGTVTGLQHTGNAILLRGGGQIFVAPGCSSIANISMSFFCWFLFSQYRRRPPRRSDIAWGLAMSAVMVVINVTRMSLIALHPDQYELIHGEVGATVASAASMIATLAFCHFGTRRAGLA
jgi:exosortase/archaeosortase family protein